MVLAGGKAERVDKLFIAPRRAVRGQKAGLVVHGYLSKERGSPSVRRRNTIDKLTDIDLGGRLYFGLTGVMCPL